MQFLTHFKLVLHSNLPNTVDSTVTCIFFFKLDFDSLNPYISKPGISTIGLKKQRFVRLSSYVNDISTELKCKQTAEEIKEKKDGNNGGKTELRTTGGDSQHKDVSTIT